MTQSYMITTPEAVQLAKQNGSGNTVNTDAMLKRADDSAYMLDYWDQTDCIVEGIKAMRDAGEVYLPKFPDEDSIDYAYRKKCTKMTNVYRDAVEGLAAKPFEQEVSFAKDETNPVPDAIEEFAENVDGSGNNLTVFAGQVFFNGINSAIHWIFVDHPPIDPSVRTIADAKATGIRPYWSHVLGRNVLEATSAIVNGKETLTLVRLFEPGKPDHIRIFTRDDAGNVTWELFEKRTQWRVMDDDGSQTQFYSIDTGIVTIGAIPLVPFITGRRDGRSFKIYPAMRDAADLQVTLYQNESALEWNKRMGAYSMLSGNGIKPEMNPDGRTVKKLSIGPNKVLYAPPNGDNKNGSWDFIQPNPGVMTFLAADNAATIQELRELGRQPLTAQSGNLTVITTAVAAGKARSAVSAWALTLKNALENAMVLTCAFIGLDTATYDPVVSVYTEFDEFAEGKDLDTLTAARKNDDISQETYWHELKRRSVLSDDFDPETEKDLIQKEMLSRVANSSGMDTSSLDVDPAALSTTANTDPTPGKAS